MDDGVETIEWLLGGDPSIRWQTLHDLVGAPEREVEAERRKVAEQGWGRRLLELQSADGTWPSAARHFLYRPYHTSTFFTLMLLRDLGLPGDDRRAHRGCSMLLDNTLRHTGIAICPPDSETCQTGIGLSLLAHFQHDGRLVDVLADHLLEQQMPGGGWNCDLSPVGQERERVRMRPPTHASVITTLVALEGLRAYELSGGRSTGDAQRRGREFLLEHRLFRSHRTGDVIDPAFTCLTFPAWGYDILRVLEHFRAVGAPRDERLSDAVGLVAEAEQRDGRWYLRHRWEGQTHFDLEPLGAPSRGLTLRASRVLRWWTSR